jgi:F-type H+-transporting ATPase subunit b
MRYLFVFLVAGLAVPPGGSLCAADKPGNKTDGEKPSKVVLHIGPDHKEVQFDLSDPKRRKDLIEAILNNQVEEISVERNPVVPEADLGIWALVIFVGLLLILRKFAWGPMVEGLQKREQSIRSAVDEAKSAREETETLRIKFKKEMDEAFAKIPLMMEEARRNAEKMAQELRTKAEADILADRERLRREIEMAKDQLIQDMFNQTAQMATLIASNVLARSLTPEDHQRMLNVAMDELKTSGSRFRQEIV